MRFERVPLDGAEGAILAHSTVAMQPGPGGRRVERPIPKGTLLTRANVDALAACGVDAVQVAWPEPGDLGEDEAAARLAQALTEGRSGLIVGQAARGRVNLSAEGPGIVDLEVAALHAVNRIAASITVATLPPWRRVGAGGLVATIKIIPFAVPGADLARACSAGRGAMGLRTCRHATATLIETRVGRAAPSDKGRRAMDARLAAFGMGLTGGRVLVPHEEEAIARALGDAPGDVLLILTETATSDLHDTAPEALRRAGGEVIHYGMPVDPGNLLFLGRLGDRPVIGLPGCARSPALNGADWVLERVICGVEVTPDDIMAMGVGGLLKDIPERGHPRRR